ncbi:hypothetical protein A1O3_08888 [Capronia epimyces CBS 606.96]|uniref:Enoyl reductase (ER) domain-containing protein n=1 Tax=Capronia epimyces CBS 606.96 TaxID=1182542 RepID=W9XR04_9EURO|nr:uncharacterized protein A1O3_08888 [Capronia epimyces CBS 606.96]EXJ79386.1 hypothetical protein A1O3_08888 [Capronia epimyces CBS 606.96]
MLEALVFSPLRVTVHRTTIPQPRENEVLIQVAVAGTNPKDWKVPFWRERDNGTNQGDDMAGVVAAVGAAVTQFKPGDRVAAFHQMMTPAGSYAEYALAADHATFHLPPHVSFEAAATIPLAAMTAALGLFASLGLPEPWVARFHPDRLPRGGIVVYGAASAVGAYAVQLARWAGIHPIIAVAGNGIPFVQGLLDPARGDVVVDYRQPNDHVVRDIRNAVPPGQRLEYAFDAVSEKAKSSYRNICQVFATQGQGGDVLDDPDIPPTVHKSYTMVGSVHDKDKDFGYAWFRLFELGLKDGLLAPHPHTVVPGGLGGVEEALRNLKEGKASATKYVVRIADTKELSGEGESKS